MNTTLKDFVYTLVTGCLHGGRITVNDQNSSSKTDIEDFIHQVMPTVSKSEIDKVISELVQEGNFVVDDQTGLYYTSLLEIKARRQIADIQVTTIKRIYTAKSGDLETIRNDTLSSLNSILRQYKNESFLPFIDLEAERVKRRVTLHIDTVSSQTADANSTLIVAA